jgi:hypothetical protein
VSCRHSGQGDDEPSPRGPFHFPWTTSTDAPQIAAQGAGRSAVSARTAWVSPVPWLRPAAWSLLLMRSSMRGRVPATGERLPSQASGLLYGIGFGGFVDGIVLHQILQWHHMISSVDGRDPGTLAGLEANTVADGFFHLGTWAAAVAGMVTALIA